MSNTIESNFQSAKERYAEIGVDVEAALKKISDVSISIHCWQGDDVGGFETKDAALSGGGIQATGNYPGKPRSIAELRQDFEKALSLIPGKHRINLHAIYGDFQGKKIDRDQISVEHFQSWIDWAKGLGLGIDFNGTFFSHPKADEGFTLSHPDQSIRDFWIEHAKRCREIASEMGKQLRTPAVTNVWIPDGYKDIPIDHQAPRKRLLDSLDKIFSQKLDKNYCKDAVESKLFGIGSESYVSGSHEFYMGYAVSRQILLCLDMGHFHPTETIEGKLSSALLFLPEVLLHVSRPVRWDSDHVVILNDDLRRLAQQLVRCDYLDKVNIGLDFFDASINRIAAWVIGTRAMLKAMLSAMLEPLKDLKEAELKGDFTKRLAMLEDLKTMPFGAVWNYFCEKNNMPGDFKWLDTVTDYEKSVLRSR